MIAHLGVSGGVAGCCVSQAQGALMQVPQSAVLCFMVTVLPVATQPLVAVHVELLWASFLVLAAGDKPERQRR